MNNFLLKLKIWKKILIKKEIYKKLKAKKFKIQQKIKV